MLDLNGLKKRYIKQLDELKQQLVRIDDIELENIKQLASEYKHKKQQLQKEIEEIAAIIKGLEYFDGKIK